MILLSTSEKLFTILWLLESIHYKVVVDWWTLVIDHQRLSWNHIVLDNAKLRIYYVTSIELAIFDSALLKFRLTWRQADDRRLYVLTEGWSLCLFLLASRA